MSVGERIASLRKSVGMTQAELAEKLSVTDKAVSKWERGLSCPDISLLPAVARELGVTADALLGGETEEHVMFVSLEKYYMGTFGYVVRDFHPDGERVALIMNSPDKDDADHGVPLSGRAGAELCKFLLGEQLPPTRVKLSELRLGVTYVSNVPLWNLDPPIDKLVDELEYTRLNKFHLDLFLLNGFIKKLEALVLSDTVRVIALTHWLNQKYFGAFISHASPDVLSLFFEKIATGRLRVLFVGVPLFWNKEDYKKPKDLIGLKEYLLDTH